MAVFPSNALALYALGMGFAGVLHLCLGADGLTVVEALAIVAVSITPAALFGTRDTPALLAMLFGATYASSAIIYKLLVFEKLDEGLYDPRTAFLVALVGISAISAAAIGAHAFFRQGAAVPTSPDHSGGFSVLIFVAIVLVLGGLFLGYGQLATVGGIAALAGKGGALLPIVLIGLNLFHGRPALSHPVLPVGGALSVLALGSNSREGLIQPLLAIMAALVCFRVELPRRTLIGGALLAILFFGLLSPALIAVRGARNFVSPAQILSLSFETLTTKSGLDRVKGVEALMSIQDGPYSLRYCTIGGEAVTRFILIQYLDIVVNRAEHLGPLGTTRYWKTIEQLLPSSLVPDKYETATPSYPLWAYGLLLWGDEHYQTLTPFGEAYSFGGLTFVAFACFINFSLIFFVLRMTIQRFENSILAAFFITAYGHELLEGYLNYPLLILLRELPFMILLFWISSRVHVPLFEWRRVHLQR